MKALIVLLILFVIGLLIFAPIFTIWSLNLLFGLTIPVTFHTWLAMAWVGGVFSGIVQGVTKATK